jgi:hypothetical protein
MSETGKFTEEILAAMEPKLLIEAGKVLFGE